MLIECELKINWMWIECEFQMECEYRLLCANQNYKKYFEIVNNHWIDGRRWASLSIVDIDDDVTFDICAWWRYRWRCLLIVLYVSFRLFNGVKNGHTQDSSALCHWHVTTMPLITVPPTTVSCHHCAMVLNMEQSFNGDLLRRFSSDILIKWLMLFSMKSTAPTAIIRKRRSLLFVRRLWNYYWFVELASLMLRRTRSASILISICNRICFVTLVPGSRAAAAAAGQQQPKILRHTVVHPHQCVKTTTGTRYSIQ